MPVGSGLDGQGRELLTFLPGWSAHPKAWSDEAAHRIGVVLRQAHEASRSFRPPAPPRWQPWYGRGLGGPDRVIGHCDVGPWNWLAGSDGLPYALIDWEFAGPVDPVWEVAHAVWLNAQLHDEDIAELHGLPPVADRARQARLLCDGYGLSAGSRAALVDMMVELAVHSARDQAQLHGVEVQRPGGSRAGGSPEAIIWGIAWRAKSASWMLRNRAVLDAAIVDD